LCFAALEVFWQLHQLALASLKLSQGNWDTSEESPFLPTSLSPAQAYSTFPQMRASTQVALPYGNHLISQCVMQDEPV
jgi:hypothetical protein